MKLGRHILALCILTGIIACPPVFAGLLADSVYHNGTIYTMTETPEEAQDTANAKTVEVVAVKDGIIVFAGSSTEAKTAGYLTPGNVQNISDLRGKVMYPGFIDGHGHFPVQGGSDLYQVNLNSPLLDGPAKDIDSLVAALKARADITPEGTPIMGQNYDDSMLAEKRHPTRDDLDRASTRHPIYITHISGHMGVANSVTLAKCNITNETTVTGVVKDAAGEPTGLLLEMEAMSLALAPLREEIHTNALAGISRANQLYAAAGVTCADDGGALLQNKLPDFQKSLSNGALQLRILVHPLGYYPHKIDMGGNPVYADVMGWMGRAALGWKQDPKDPLGEYSDGSGALKIGSDITSMDIPIYDPASKKQTSLLPAPANLPSNMLFFAPWKIFQDGSPQGYTAWFKEPGYYDWGEYTAADSFDPTAPSFIGLPGTINTRPEDLSKWVMNYHRYGQSIEVHTNGPAAAEAYLSAIEKAVATFPGITDTRHTFIHAQTIERQHIERMMGLYENLAGTENMYTGLSGAFANGVVDTTMGGLLPAGNLGELMAAQNIFASYFNNHTYFYGHRHSTKFFGPGRAKNISPAGWSLAYGQRFSFHNDTPVTPISPLRSIQSGVTRVCGDTDEGYAVTGSGKDVNAKAQYLPNIFSTEKVDFWDYDQRVNALQALHAVTIAPAWQNKVEDRLGSIEVGKAADFAILDEDIIAVAASDPMRLASLRIAATIVNDKVVHGVLPDSEALAGQLLPGYEDSDVEEFSVETIANIDAEEKYAPLDGNEKRLGTFSFTAKKTSAPTNNKAIFRMNFLGNGDTADSMRLYAFEGLEKKGFVYAKSGEEATPGHWWIASMHNPSIVLDSSSVLENDVYYIAFFVMSENSSKARKENEPAIFNGVVGLVTTGKLPENGFYGPKPDPEDSVVNGIYFPFFKEMNEENSHWNGFVLKNWADTDVSARIFVTENGGNIGYQDVTIPKHSMYAKSLKEMLPLFRRIAGNKPFGAEPCAISVALPPEAAVDGFGVTAGKESGETASYLAQPWDGQSAIPEAYFPYLTEMQEESEFQNTISIFNPDGNARSIHLEFQEEDGDRGTLIIPVAEPIFTAKLADLLPHIEKNSANKGQLGDSRVSITATAEEENAALLGLMALARQITGESASYLSVHDGAPMDKDSSLYFPYFTALNGQDGYWNGLAIINKEEQDVPATLRILEESGNIGSLEITIPAHSMYVTELSSIVPAIQRISGDHSFGTSRCAVIATLHSPAKIQGFAMLARPDTGESMGYLAQKESQEAVGSILRFPYFTEMSRVGGWWNGLSFIDPSGSTEHVRMYFEEEDGDRGTLDIGLNDSAKFFTVELSEILQSIKADETNKGVLGDARVAIRVEADSPLATLLGFAMIGVEDSGSTHKNSMGYLPLHEKAPSSTTTP